MADSETTTRRAGVPTEGFDLEDHLADAKAASIVLETMFEDAHRNSKAGNGYQSFQLTDDQVTGLTYAIYHVGRLVRAADKAYYASLEPAREGERAQAGS